MATSVRNMRELDLRSVLFFAASALSPSIENMGSGLSLFCGPGLFAAFLSVFLQENRH